MPRTHGQALAFLLGLWIAIQLSPFGPGPAGAETPRAGHQALEAALHEAVNATRQEHHMIPLSRHPELDAVARAHAHDMAQRGYLDHHNPEGENPVDRLQGNGLDGFTLAAENLGRTTQHPPNRHILEGWMASAVHRRNLLTSAFNATGVAVVATPDGALVYAQVYVTYPR